MSDPGFEWRLTLKRRIVVAAGLLGLWVTGIEARLVYLQVFQSADLTARAARQQSGSRSTPAKRGDILDRRGHLLATSVDVDSIYAVPSEIHNDEETVGKLCDAFGSCSAREREALTDRLKNQRFFAYVRRQVSPDEAGRVAALNLDGIGFIKESRRFYPNKELAAHLLGYVGVDGNGLEGLEWTYDSQIRGKPGTVLIHTDARRHAFSRFERPPTTGSTIELTIDEYLQHIAERELHAGIVEHRAEGGTAVIMNPRTGEILAMANEPTFNPNTYREAAEANRRNRAVRDLYEPGSTFKIVTASAAIEEKVMPIDAMIDTNPGFIRIGNSVVDEYEGHKYGVLSFSDVIVRSSNVGAIKIGFKVGTERLSRFVSLFGFGRRVSPDFPGENAGIVWKPEQWTERALASVSMGYQIAVTPLQVAAAFSSVANGGEYIEPRVLRALYRDGRRYAITPKIVRRTISQDTAATLTTIMEGVVTEGTAKAAQIGGYTIAGKTGTASKLIDGRYSASDNNASFAGFLPSRNPAVTIVIVIDAPHAGGRTGGVVAAPIFKRIAEPTLRYLGVGPTIDPEPPVIVERRDTADVRTRPQKDTQPIVSFVTDGPPGTVPNLHGMSARDAVRKLVQLGLTAHLSGDGFVMSQDPPAGAVLEPGAVCSLVLSRWVAQSDPVVQP
ncbi:MAG TPA: penicillin-binding transpeptidase domain-containing protein [Vicinamibacterales bacterium]